MQNLDATTAWNTARDETTWGELGVWCRAKVEGDHMQWLFGLEEENLSEQHALRCEVPPLANRRSGTTMSLLNNFAK
jgi:hypothetical protein